MKKLLLLVALLAFPACNNLKPPQSLPDGYVIARATVQGAQILLAGADGLFEVLTAFIDAEKLKDVKATFYRIRASVVTGLQLALDGINVAESQKQGFDLGKLMAQANAAWTDLRAFLESLSAPAMKSVRKIGEHKPPTIADLPKLLFPAH